MPSSRLCLSSSVKGPSPLKPSVQSPSCICCLHSTKLNLCQLHKVLSREKQWEITVEMGERGLLSPLSPSQAVNRSQRRLDKPWKWHAYNELGMGMRDVESDVLSVTAMYVECDVHWRRTPSSTYNVKVRVRVRTRCTYNHYIMWTDNVMYGYIQCVRTICTYKCEVRVCTVTSVYVQCGRPFTWKVAHCENRTDVMHWWP